MITDLDLLKEKIKDSKMTMTGLAEKAGILRETLYNKVNGESEFKASEIIALSDALHLNKNERDEIFFANKV